MDQFYFFPVSFFAVEVIINIEGMTPGAHGFHIHQFGDFRGAGFESVGYHFAPICNPPKDPTVENPCKGDDTHGLPPSPIRHPGDMGSVTADAQGKVTNLKLTLGEGKLSLDDTIKSIIGRTVTIHANEDNGKTDAGHPNGFSGGPHGGGVIVYATTAPGDEQVATYATSYGSVLPGVNLVCSVNPIEDNNLPEMAHVLIQTKDIDPADNVFYSIISASAKVPAAGRYTVKLLPTGDMTSPSTAIPKDLSPYFPLTLDVIGDSFSVGSAVGVSKKFGYAANAANVDALYDVVGHGCGVFDSSDKLIGRGVWGIGNPDLAFNKVNSVDYWKELAVPTTEPTETYIMPPGQTGSASTTTAVTLLATLATAFSAFLLF
jgi:Cu/Zn superoxide dismutase